MKILDFPAFLEPLTSDYQRTDAINARIPGWSGPMHYAFFRTVLERSKTASVLMLGVYHGRDLAFIADLGRPVELVGVDLFSPGPCADWSVDDRSKTWQEMGFGPNPSMEAAMKNVPSALIVVGDSVGFMRSCERKFDLIYFDTSHDANTLRAELDASSHCRHADTILCGDDYNDNPNWGVKKVVDESFSEKRIYPPIWLSGVPYLR